MSITGSTFTANTAAGGNGGIFNNAAGSNAQGGSIYFEGGTLNISGSRIEASLANGGNGGNQDQSGQTNGGGDGNTTNDIVIAADCESVQLRSERMGDGNGRVYTVTLKATDASGNVSTATAKVTVPHSQNGAAAVDDGPLYTVLSGCP